MCANKADDPLSYYELSKFHDRSSEEWLRCISKAAASGFQEAQLELARFYRDIAPKDSTLLQSDQSGALKKALNWLLGWRADSAIRLAIEWFETAGKNGHKLAMLELANLYESLGEKENAQDQLRRIVAEIPKLEAGTGTMPEKWPEVVNEAKRRLAGVRMK